MMDLVIFIIKGKQCKPLVPHRGLVQGEDGSPQAEEKASPGN